MSLININLAVSTVVIIIVFILQYIFRMAPCEMCLIERYPYYLLIFIGVISFIFNQENKPSFKKISNYISLLILLFGFFYTLRHVGVERGLINLNSGCNINLSNSSDKSLLLESLTQAPLIRCDEPSYLLNLLSVAEANLIITTLLLLISLYFIFFKNER